MFFAACATQAPPPVQAPPAVGPSIAMERLPELGDRLADLPPTSVYTMAASAQLWLAYDTKVNGVAFTIGVDGESRVRFISTCDQVFASPEGLHPGDAMTAAIKAAPGETVRKERGWGHYLLLPSGWYAYLDDSRFDASGKEQVNLGTRPLGRNAVVTMLFKRD